MATVQEEQSPPSAAEGRGPAPKTLFLILTGLVLAQLVGAVIVALDYAGPGRELVRNPIMLYAFGAGLIGLAALGITWKLIDRSLLKASRALSRDIVTLLQAKRIDRALRVPPGHGLDGLPAAIDQLVQALRTSRREAIRAMVTATARVEQEKGWLEVILLELVREAVLVLSADHRVLLYNHSASRLLRSTHALGLGRSLFDLVAEAPVRHAIERIQLRRESGYADVSAGFVCATSDNRLMLRARMAMMLDPNDRPNGYVLTLEDIGAELEEQSRTEVIRRIVTQDMRGSLASLRAAAETLTAYPDISPDSRKAFETVVLSESTTLSKRIEDLALRYEGISIGHGPMAEVHSNDLFGCLARQLAESEDPIELSMVGEAHWLEGDSHALMLVLEHLVRHIAARESVRAFEARADLDDATAFVELIWPGRAVASGLLDDWLNEPLAGLAGVSAASVLAQHGSEIWSQNRGGDRAVLRLPLQPPAAQQPEQDGTSIAPRPEFYDFDLMNTDAISEELGARSLKDLTYVVFDTETTGLRPTDGDEIISIAAVRVTKGRVLSGETFQELVNPGRNIPKDSIRFHGITDDMVVDAPSIREVLPRFQVFAGDAVLVAHNAAFDMKFIKLKQESCGLNFSNPVMDTMLLSLLIDGDEEDHSLDGVCERLDITVENRHSAYGDAIATAEALAHFLDRLEARGIRTFREVMDASNMEAALRFRAGHF